jgi:hypothetical protein
MMMGRVMRRLTTAFGALLFVAVGFAAGAAGSAWQTREQRAQPWKKIRVEHQGQDGAPTRTRLVFENPKLAVQAIEVTRDAEGNPEIARVSLREGEELTLRYGEDRRPSSLQAGDGARADIEYHGTKAHVFFAAPDGSESAAASIAVPIELRSALRLAAAAVPGAELGALGNRMGDLLVGEAFAQDKDADDPPITARRSVQLSLDVRMQEGERGGVELDATCAPLTCAITPAKVDAPGATAVRIDVSGSLLRSKLAAPAGKAELEPYKAFAAAERGTARRVLPDVAGVVAAVGVVAQACTSKKVASAVCVPELVKNGAGAGAIRGILAHHVETEGAAVNERAETIWYEEEARVNLDRETKIEVCANREGFARVCTEIAGRPFANEPLAPVARSVDVRRGIGGTLAGSFFVVQSDGADCKFSPSPKTTGALKLTFDNEKNQATASLKASERGTRPNLGCSLGVANMSWSQTYTINATQTFTKQEMQSTGKLAIRMTGTMSGNGSYSFSNCRTSGGGSVNCPAGKSDSYAYPVELVGEIDMATQTGTGSIVVKNAPLATSGSWRVPAEKTP